MTPREMRSHLDWLDERRQREAEEIRAAYKKKMPIVIINRGPTKADRLATVRIEGGTSETLDAIVDGLRQ
jgi:hypothetical protein